MGFCGFEPSEYQPVPVKVKVNVEFLQASWLTGRFSSEIGRGARTVAVAPAGTMKAPVSPSWSRSRLARGHAGGAWTPAIPRR